MALELAASWLAIILLYALTHEFIHLVSAKALGCQAKMGVSSDSLYPSLSVHVSCRDGGRLHNYVILYSPYLVNLAILITPLNTPYIVMAKIAAAVTLPNAILESSRSSLRLVAALLLALLAVYILCFVAP